MVLLAWPQKGSSLTVIKGTRQRKGGQEHAAQVSWSLRLPISANPTLPILMDFDQKDCSPAFSKALLAPVKEERSVLRMALSLLCLQQLKQCVCSLMSIIYEGWVRHHRRVLHVYKPESSHYAGRSPRASNPHDDQRRIAARACLSTSAY